MTIPAPSPIIPPRKRSAAALVAIGILFSRISGLVRDRVFAHYLGNSYAAGAFRAALRIPNFLQNLFGEGVLSASFIPVYSRLIAQGDTQLAGRVAGAVASILTTVVTILVAFGVLLTPAFVELVAPGFEGEVKILTIHLVQILFPGMGLLVVSAWCLGVLNSHRKFFLSYAAPVLWNLAMIAALFWKGGKVTEDQLAVTLAWASVVGSALQLGVQLPFVFRCAKGLRFGFQTLLAPVREVFRHFGTVVISRGVVQISAYIDGMIASFLGASAVASLAYAQTIYLLPIGLFGMSVAAAELPEMSSAVGTEEERFLKLRGRIYAGRRNISFFVIPSLVAFLILGHSVVAALYQTGRFGAEDTLFVWYILMGSVVGLLAATWGRLYSSAFYALGDTKTPLRFALLRVVLTASLGLLFAFPLRPMLVRFFTEVLHLRMPNIPGIELGLGAVGVTIASGLAGWVEYYFLQRSMGKKIGSTALPLSFHAKVWFSALPAAGFALFFEKYLYSDFTRDVPVTVLGYDLRPIVVLGLYGVLFLGTAMVMQLGEARRLLGRFSARYRS